MKTIKVNENTYKILIKTSNLTGIGISEIVQNLVKDNDLDNFKITTPEIFTLKGELKSQFKKAEEIYNASIKKYGKAFCSAECKEKGEK